MHRLYNYGSALQAYALQHVIDKMGFDAEIIDYNYPNSFQYSKGVRPPVNNWKTKAIRLMGCFHPHNRVRRKFQCFWSKHLTLSSYFSNFDEIHKGSFSYDLCVTGSDQVWNPAFTKGDTTFLLDFIDKRIPKISYASSFSTTNLNEEYRDVYAKQLSRYKAISVRERGGMEIVYRLTGKHAVISVDPTLLLTANDWLPLSQTHNLKIKTNRKYLLLYVLSYAFNPAPYIYELAYFIGNKLNLPIVAIGGRNYSSRECAQIHWIEDAGPLDFVHLFANASAVVTSSFHGTAFAVNFGKKVFSVVKRDSADDRISSFLKEVGLEKAIVSMGTPLEKVPITEEYISIAQQSLEKRREDSMRYLRNAITDNLYR